MIWTALFWCSVATIAGLLGNALEQRIRPREDLWKEQAAREYIQYLKNEWEKRE